MEVTTKYIDYDRNVRRVMEQELKNYYTNVQEWYYYRIYSDMKEMAGQGYCKINVPNKPSYFCILTYYPLWDNLTHQQKSQLTTLWTRCTTTDQKIMAVHYFPLLAPP